jgi:predicted Zn-dependent protease
VGGVVSENLGALINAPVEVVGGAWLSRYSRGQESESDRLGIGTAARSGYDPAALGDILRRIDREVTSQTGEERRFSFFDSHPMTESRLEDIGRPGGGSEAGRKPPIAGDAAAFLARLDGVWWGENPRPGCFGRTAFCNPPSASPSRSPRGGSIETRRTT